MYGKRISFSMQVIIVFPYSWIISLKHLTRLSKTLIVFHKVKKYTGSRIMSTKKQLKYVWICENVPYANGTQLLTFSLAGNGWYSIRIWFIFKSEHASNFSCTPFVFFETTKYYISCRSTCLLNTYHFKNMSLYSIILLSFYGLL